MLNENNNISYINRVDLHTVMMKYSRCMLTGYSTIRKSKGECKKIETGDMLRRNANISNNKRQLDRPRSNDMLRRSVNIVSSSSSISYTCNSDELNVKILTCMTCIRLIIMQDKMQSAIGDKSRRTMIIMTIHFRTVNTIN